MEKKRKRALVMLFVSLISMIFGTPVMALFALRARYVLLAIMIPITAHGYYGFGYYFIAYRHNKVFIRLKELIDGGILSSDELAKMAGLSKRGIDYFLTKMEKKGYVAKDLVTR